MKNVKISVGDMFTGTYLCSACVVVLVDTKNGNVFTRFIDDCEVMCHPISEWKKDLADGKAKLIKKKK